MIPGLFVVGTDTGVGKTRVAAALAASLTRSGRRVGVLKPVATGAQRVGNAWSSDDAGQLMAALPAPVPLDRVAPLIFEEPLAPSVAARRQGRPLTFEAVRVAVVEALAWWAERAEVMVFEGIGGFLTPLADDATLADLAVALDYPLLIVARRGLGTLNHTLLTVEAARLRGLRLAGVVLNSPEPEAGTVAEATNADELARRLGDCPLLDTLAYRDDPADLVFAVGALDWYDRAGWPRIEGGLWRFPPLARGEQDDGQRRD